MGKRLAEILRAGAPAFAALLVLCALHAILIWRLPGDAFATGASTIEPAPHLGRILAYYLIFGGASVLLLAWGLLRLFPDAATAGAARLRQGSDRSFVVAVSLLAFALGAFAYQYLLQRMPLTDDENVYRFATQILAEGRLFLPSDPDKDFFDHLFLINDGRTYTQYFLGWPALLAPFLALGLEGYANAAYLALTIPAIFLILRRLSSPLWARVGCLLAVASPMLTITAGTLLAHSSCTAALAYFLYCALRCRDDDAAWHWHAGLAATFCIAFFNRPLTALGFGLPVLASWLWDRRRSRAPLRDLLAFAVPAAAAAALFLWINAAQTGHPLRTPYQAYLSYTTGSLDDAERREMDYISVVHSIATTAAAFFRLNFATFGWPCSWLFVFFGAGGGPYRRVLLATVISFFASNLLTVHVGIDTYAPMHFIEIGLPLVLLTVLGLARTTGWAAALGRHLSAAGAAPRWSPAAVPAMVAAASTAVALFFYVPYQAMVVWRSANLEKLSRGGLEQTTTPAVVFVVLPYSQNGCYWSRPLHWVRSPPINPPDLEADHLWLIHLDLDRDRELMARRFPGRHGYLLRWKRPCVREWVPLEAATERDFPPGSPDIFSTSALRAKTLRGQG